MAVLVTTFTNPTLAASGWFGGRVAALGNDGVLIGAWGETEAAYLFRTDGTLLTAFTNSVPAANDAFGGAVAGVGGDRVLIGAFGNDAGAPSAGTAYLFRTNGMLLTTFTNPIPAGNGHFGTSVAAMEGDLILIGADGNIAGATDAGAAYLFRTDGTLLTTFTNPTPASLDRFGAAVAAVGGDRVIIGAWRDETGPVDADTGAAYLFSTNGNLLTTFTSPALRASRYFGISVAAMGNDRVLIGAEGDRIGGVGAGVAYLFRTDGVLLTTLTNPTPAVGDFFGNSVAAMGSDRVLVGAAGDDTGATNAGAVYLFSTNGTLLATFTNPTPAANDAFGFSVAAVGNDRVLIGAVSDDTGATDTGAAYLFSLVPALAIRLTTTNTVAVSWLSPSTGFLLQENTNDISPGNWSNVSGTIQDDGLTKTFLVEPPTGQTFYRLFKP